MSVSFRDCLSTLRISTETFRKTNWNLRGDNDLVRSMIKCIMTNFGLFDESQNETGSFNIDRMVKQLGGEAIRARVEKCIDGNPIGEPTVDESVQKVMNCLEDDNLKLYKE